MKTFRIGLLAAATLYPEAQTPLVIALVGDSTVNEEGGWGPGFAAAFGPGVKSLNFALNGRSSKSFRSEGAWEPVLAAKAAQAFVQVAPALKPLLSQAPAATDDTQHTLTALLEGTGFVRIPAGEFTMGSTSGNPDEQPEHRVRISREFEISRFEVTQAQWDAVMRNPHAASADAAAEGVNPSHFKGPARPVENVSWDAVQVFLQRINKRDPKHVYRLPTEAEWEYAARAGQADSGALEATAWFEQNSERHTQPVGRKKPNAWGLYDMLGNVKEWVQDWYSPEAYSPAPATDPDGPDAGSYKVHRGCGWVSAANQCRVSFRGFDFPNPGQYSVGFRLVRTSR